MNINKDEIYYSKHGEPYKILEYKNSANVYISYLDNPSCVVKTFAVNIRKGNTPNPFRVVVSGAGYHGVGNPINVEGKKTEAYIKWHGMLSRCYDKLVAEKRKKLLKCYRDVDAVVDKSWHNYQSFYNWFEMEKSKISWTKSAICLDSDLFNSKGNLYSENTCALLPYELNIAVQLASVVSFDKRRGVYYARVSRTLTKESSHVARAVTERDAWLAYGEFKDKYVKDVYNLLGCKLPERTEHALLNFNSLKRLQEIGTISGFDV